MNETLDPRECIYDPLRRENLGRSVLWALMIREPVRIDQVPRFNGCGIYAIYYTGPHELYTPISNPKCETPIYVGKSDPKGGRKGIDVEPAWKGTKLWSRLSQHARKLRLCQDLDVRDFYTRYLPADDLFTPMAERLMIAGFQPVWNIVLEGFGVNQQGSGREDSQRRPKWHELHYGVPWADGMPGQPGGAEPLAAAVRTHLAANADRRPEFGVPGVTSLPDDQLGFDSIDDDE